MASRVIHAVAISCVAALLAVGLAGCQGSDGSAGSTAQDPQPTAPSPTDPKAEAKAAAITAYKGMWDAYAKAGETADQKDPGIRRYATGNARTRIVAALLGYREDGLVTKGHLKMSPKVTSLKPAADPTTAEILDCADSTNWTTHKRATGEKVDEPAGRREITATVVLDHDVWKVSDFDAKDVGSC
jgi:hypothetical protein